MNRDQELHETAAARAGYAAATPLPTVGTLTNGEGPDGPSVRFPGGPRDGVVARTCIPLTADDCGRSVVLLFEANDWRRPLIMGLLRDGAVGSEQLGQGDVAARATTTAPEKLRVTALQQLVFQCGKSSLTLTESGKVLIKGTYVLSSSTGLNRIRGGSVEIN